ncbi:MAG: DNA-3-methyladenine glycosylase [Polyangiaceae bacterium]|nr:DNA-3-methyladenine glycosylase [Polyangiaceae bacterium]
MSSFGVSISPGVARARTRALPRSFYARPVLQVARDCLGKVLNVRRQGIEITGRIVETEAYRGPQDLAAHTAGNVRTARNEAMYGPAGHAYIFLIYGMHIHFNLVTGQEGQGHAVLIRALEPLQGIDRMLRYRRRTLRSVTSDSPALTNGPGKLCQAFDISREDNLRDLCGQPAPEIFLSEGPRARCRRTPRIGIDYAGSWRLKPWRFIEPGNRYVSRSPRTTLTGP